MPSHRTRDGDRDRARECEPSPPAEHVLSACLLCKPNTNSIERLNMPIHKAGVWLTHGFLCGQNRANRARHTVVAWCVVKQWTTPNVFGLSRRCRRRFGRIAVPFCPLTAFAFGGASVRRARSERIIGFYLCY